MTAYDRLKKAYILNTHAELQILIQKLTLRAGYMQGQDQDDFKKIQTALLMLQVMLEEMRAK